MLAGASWSRWCYCRLFILFPVALLFHVEDFLKMSFCFCSAHLLHIRLFPSRQLLLHCYRLDLPPSRLRLKIFLSFRWREWYSQEGPTSRCLNSAHRNWVTETNESDVKRMTCWLWSESTLTRSRTVLRSAPNICPHSSIKQKKMVSVQITMNYGNFHCQTRTHLLYLGWVTGRISACHMRRTITLCFPAVSNCVWLISNISFQARKQRGFITHWAWIYS